MAEQPLIGEDDGTETPPGGPPNSDAGSGPAGGDDDAGSAGSGEDDDSAGGGEDEGDVGEIASADDYKIPEIEGFDADIAASSPVFAAMRAAAFKAGLDQEGFDDAIKSYVEESTTRTAEARTAEMGKLGANAKARISAVASFITSKLPAAQAEALRSAITTADQVKAIETLMGTGARRSAAPAAAAPARETRAQIEHLMASKEYSGRESERDPAVIAKVDAWFQAEAKEAAKKK